MSGLTGVAVLGGIGAAATFGGAALQAGAAGNQADAAKYATDKQLDFAREALEKQVAERNRMETAVLGLAAKSPDELAATGRMLNQRALYLNTQSDNLSKVQSILDKVDPSIKEAASQQLDLLQGKESQVLAPLQAQRQRQRQQLQNSLSEKLGPGYATSSAGIQALQGFDDQSFSLMTDAQMKALTTVSDVLQKGLATRPDLIGQTSAVYKDIAATDSNLMSTEAGATNRKVNAFLGAGQVANVDFGGPSKAYGDASKQEVATAGGGANVWGQALAGFGGQVAGIGTSYASAQMYKNLFTDVQMKPNTGGVMPVPGAVPLLSR
jgi:hypothetical protein